MRFDERVGIAFGWPRLESMSDNGIFVRVSSFVGPAEAGSAAFTRVEAVLD